jgi:hypothetical protein
MAWLGGGYRKPPGSTGGEHQGTELTGSNICSSQSVSRLAKPKKTPLMAVSGV